MTFLADFRDIVGPKLQAMAKYQGLLIVIGDQSWSVAYRLIVHEALRLGAAHLPPDYLLDLEEAVSDWLLEAIHAAQPAWDEAQRQAERVAQQLARHEAKLT